MIQVHEVDAIAPLYRRGEPMDACPCCEDGVLRYNYFKGEDSEIIDYIECDNLLCGNYIQMIQLRLFR